MFLLVRYLDWDTHEEFTYVRVVLRSGGWQFFPTKEALIGWLNNRKDSVRDFPTDRGMKR